VGFGNIDLQQDDLQREDLQRDDLQATCVLLIFGVGSLRARGLPRQRWDEGDDGDGDDRCDKR
jgi:hypothetical protein